MCMAVPSRVLSVSKGTAVIEFLGVKREANCSIMPCKKGDYVVVNAGFVVEIVPEEEALACTRLFKNGKC